MKLTQSHIDKLIRQALQEDAAGRDITTQTLIPLGTPGRAQLIARQDMILCGMEFFKTAFELRDSRISVSQHFQEGAKVKKGMELAEVAGPARGILSAERVALNFLQRLSGIATLTGKFVEQLKGTKAKLLDTRKTTPGWRLLERYAVKTGGGMNHRFDLSEAVMVKDNHLALVGDIHEVLRHLKKIKRKVPVIVEVDSLSGVRAALDAKVPYLQLDNMTLPTLKKAVALAKGSCRLEATGGITLKNIRAVAKTGVDFISVGAITHSAPAADLSLEFLV